MKRKSAAAPERMPREAVRREAELLSLVGVVDGPFAEGELPLGVALGLGLDGVAGVADGVGGDDGGGDAAPDDGDGDGEFVGEEAAATVMLSFWPFWQ